MTQGDKRVLSFVSQAMGLMAELDVDTEHLRFMGDTWVITSCSLRLTYVSFQSLYVWLPPRRCAAQELPRQSRHQGGRVRYTENV